MKIWTLLALISTQKRRKQLDLQSGQQNANAKNNLNANGPTVFSTYGYCIFQPVDEHLNLLILIEIVYVAFRRTIRC